MSDESNSGVSSQRYPITIISICFCFQHPHLSFVRPPMLTWYFLLVNVGLLAMTRQYHSSDCSLFMKLWCPTIQMVVVYVLVWLMFSTTHNILVQHPSRGFCRVGFKVQLLQLTQSYRRKYIISSTISSSLHSLVQLSKVWFFVGNIISVYEINKI